MNLPHKYLCLSAVFLVSSSHLRYILIGNYKLSVTLKKNEGMVQGMIKIARGLDIPIAGEPDQRVTETCQPKKVGILGSDYIGLKASLAVKLGDHVKVGDLLFTDKKNPGICYTSPGCGVVSEINRGEARLFQSIVITVDGHQYRRFPQQRSSQLDRLSPLEIRDRLVESGLWTSFKTRPFSKVPPIGAEPEAIFVTAIDTNPLAADPDVVIGEHPADFLDGLRLIAGLTSGWVHVCHAPSSSIPLLDHRKIKYTAFGGPHPAGLAGTHIHFLHPVSLRRRVWSVHYQDVIAIGKLFTTGQVFTERIIALGGPSVVNPGLIRCPMGASLEELVAYRLRPGEHRLISGSVLSGHHAAGPFVYLGRYHLAASVLEEGRRREFLGWVMPGFDKFSLKKVFASKLLASRKKFAFTTNSGGSLRAMVPIGSYEKVMPLDIEATFLLRSLLSQDLERAVELGVLELDEEDLALCTFVCPGKIEYAPQLRSCLTMIEREF
jgi:Na+-transporting NADH:ubiquinone oxidoreductase subunit A